MSIPSSTPADSVKPKARRLLVLLAILLAVIVVDQATKSIARQTLSGVPAQEFAGGIARLEYAENAGAFLSLGAQLTPEARFWIFTVFVLLLLMGLLVFALRMSDHTPMLVVAAIGLVIGGGISNLIDRLFNEGRVSDFMQLGVGPLHTGIFNVADLAIMGGLALMLLAAFQPEKSATT